MIKTNKLLLGLGLSTVVALPLVIASCKSNETPILDNELTTEVANSFFYGGKWDGKTSLVAQDFEEFKTIDDSALRGKGLVSVSLHHSITSIGENAFDNNLLTSLNIPNSVIEIGDDAFVNNQLTIDSSITLPAQFDTPKERRRIGLPFEIINLELTPKTSIETIVESEVAHLNEIGQDVDNRSLALIKKLFEIQGTTIEKNLMDGLQIKILSNGVNKTILLSAKNDFKINGDLTEINSMSFIALINLELSRKTNIGLIMESEVIHLNENYQDVDDRSLALIKKLFGIQGTTTEQNLMDGLKIKMLSNGVNKIVYIEVKEGFIINGDLNNEDSEAFIIKIPPNH